MADAATDEGFLLALLNSTPVIDGVPADDLADPARAQDWLAGSGGLGTEAELRHWGATGWTTDVGDYGDWVSRHESWRVVKATA